MEMKRIPEEYVCKPVKERLVKSRETQIKRTVGARIVDQTNQKWRVKTLIQMVKDDKKRIRKMNI